MGLADAMIKMGIKYGSPKSLELCDQIGNFLANIAIATSASLASIHGFPYPKYNSKLLESEFFINHKVEDVKDTGLYNSQLLTIAPTGTISTMIGVSGGIEPIFANSYTRTTKTLHGHDEVYKIYTPIVERYMKEYGIEKEEDLPDYFVTSAVIPVCDRIAMQAIWQNHIDASISSTINLPHEATIEDIEKLYMGAWKSGLKGITVYRAGCAREGILVDTNTQKEKPQETPKSDKPEWGSVIECSDDLIGIKRKLQTGCGSLHVSAWFDPCSGELMETYFSKGSTGGCNNFMIGLSRMVSLACRAGVNVYTIKDQLDSTGVCPSYATRRATKNDVSKGTCCPMAIGNALIEMYEEINGLDRVKTAKREKENTPKNGEVTYNICPECGAKLKVEGGCRSCPECGFSYCS